VIRVAFAPPDPTRWTGGYQYYLNLFRILHRHGQGRVRPVAFMAPEVSPAVLAPFTADLTDLVQAGPFSAGQRTGRLIDALVKGRDGKAEALYRRHGIQVVFEAASYHGVRFALPAIAWLPDFQHRRLPEMFGRRAWWQRELGNRAQIRTARAVMVSSESARADCEELYPAARGKIQVVPFAVELTEEAFAVSAEEVRARYGLAGEFFYLPNQFWKHKNHAGVIRALGLLRERGIRLVVAASGTQADPRHPHLMDELRALVAQLRLEDQFRFLGMVSRADVYALMRAATAVLNPSTFEGWSTTVEEAKAMGVPLVLSDLPVHREQVGEAGSYFDPRSPGAIADCLERAGPASSAADAANGAAAAAQRTIPGLRAYAARFETLVESVLQG
jgi:glycosyltransferase involved in cell wall biosynthesis